MRNGLLHDGLEYWRRNTPHKTAVVLDDTDTLSYEELGRWSDGIASQLMASGVEAGDRVGISAANSLEWVASAFAVLKCGAIIAPMNERFVADEFRYLIEFCEPSIIIADERRRETMASLAQTPPILAIENMGAYRSGPPDGWRPERVSSDAAAMIVFTSGSSGTPKGVVLSHDEQLGKFFEMTLGAPELGPDTRSLMPLGIQSAPGTAWGYLFSSTIGGTFYFMRRYSAEATLATLAEQRITTFVAFPLLYREVSNLPGFTSADLSSLTFARCGGATLPRDTWTRWRDKKVTIRALYGMTECGGGALIATESEAMAKPDSCGRGMLFTQVKILRDDGTPCAPDEPGNVYLRGPGIMVGYWRNPQATAETLVDGWLRTGDIGILDEEGYFFFVDRAKEIVKCGGFNVSPIEVENVLRELEAIEDAAVFSVPDEKYVEVPLACIVLRSPTEKTRIFEHCKDRLANFKLPRYVEIVDDLPRIAGGKVDRQSLKGRYADAQYRLHKIG